MTPIADQYYDIYTPAITFTYATFVQTPACGYALDYSFWEFDTGTSTYSALPAWISESAAIFTVQTNDPSFEALHKIVVRGSVPIGYPVFQDELIVDVVVANGCLVDEVTATGSVINDFTYIIAEDGLLSWIPTWTSTVTGCPLTYEIGRIVTSVE